VLFISTATDGPSASPRASTGAQVLHKPFGVHDLAIKVREVLGRAS
jgi:hypothetical protein